MHQTASTTCVRTVLMSLLQTCHRNAQSKKLPPTHPKPNPGHCELQFWADLSNKAVNTLVCAFALYRLIWVDLYRCPTFKQPLTHRGLYPTKARTCCRITPCHAQCLTSVTGSTYRVTMYTEHFYRTSAEKQSNTLQAQSKAITIVEAVTSLIQNRSGASATHTSWTAT